MESFLRYFNVLYSLFVPVKMSFFYAPISEHARESVQFLCVLLEFPQKLCGNIVIIYFVFRCVFLSACTRVTTIQHLRFSLTAVLLKCM